MAKGTFLIKLTKRQVMQYSYSLPIWRYTAYSNLKVLCVQQNNILRRDNESFPIDKQFHLSLRLNESLFTSSIKGGETSPPPQHLRSRSSGGITHPSTSPQIHLRHGIHLISLFNFLLF